MVFPVVSYELIDQSHHADEEISVADETQRIHRASIHGGLNVNALPQTKTMSSVSSKNTTIRHSFAGSDRPNRSSAGSGSHNPFMPANLAYIA